MGKVRSAVQCSRKSKRKHCLTAKQKRYLKLKRGLDFGMSLGACVVLSPALLALSAAIKLDSRGPVLFKQTRRRICWPTRISILRGWGIFCAGLLWTNCRSCLIY